MSLPFEDSFHEIIDNIYVGNIFSSVHQPLLNKLECIVNLVDNNIRDSSKKNLIISIKDVPEENIIPVCEESYKFLMENNGKGSLVHCLAGGSRSVSVVLYYIMKKYNKTYDEAYNFFISKRSNININRGFVAQLKAYDVSRIKK